MPLAACSMKDHAAAEVSDEDFARRAERWPHDTPDTKEAYYIRDIFDSESPARSLTRCRVLTVAADLFPSEAAAKTAVRYVVLRVLPDACAHPRRPGGYQEATGAAPQIPAAVRSRSTPRRTRRRVNYLVRYRRNAKGRSQFVIHLLESNNREKDHYGLYLRQDVEGVCVCGIKRMGI